MRAIHGRLHGWGASVSNSGRWWLAAMLVIFAGLRVLAAVHKPLSFPDTPGYMQLNFLGYGPRLWTVPLVWNIFPANALREAAQIAIGVTAWSALAVSVETCMRGTVWLRRIAVALVLMLGLVPQVAGWDGNLLSESVSTSLLVLLISLMLRLTQSRSRRLLGSALLVTMLWVFARHVNVYIYLVLLPFLLGFTVWRLPRRSASLVAVALLGIALWGGFAVTRPGVGPVWKRNALYIVMDRIAHDRDAARFFRARGIPAVLLQKPLSVTYTHEADLVSRDPRVMGWMTHHFRGTYLAYLARHGSSAVESSFVRGLPYIFLPLPIGRARHVLPNAVAGAVWGSSSGEPILIWMVLGAAALLLIATLSGAEVSALAAVALLILIATIGTVVIWNATDPVMTLARQFMPVAVTLRLGLMLAVAFSLDAVWVAAAERLRGRSTVHSIGRSRPGEPGPL